eukprot:TRINITY_DN12242_c0_g2_i2.p1 TRINITY_DN12242_c0_g2~~TRINITY_DN12242_c0_g2_i2.p1  ORF type:complete len:216 (-),score=83.22 TRINITY_DN12242_c0_g2_i2:109-756(-)
MFGSHKQHPVVEPDHALKQLRAELYSQLEKGKLKADYTDNVLLDIRQALLTCDQMKSKIVTKVNSSFTKLIKAVKARKVEFLAEVDKYFDTERAKILDNEDNWKHKQQLSQDLLRLNSSAATDSELIKNGTYVYDSISKLNEPVKFHEMKLISSVDDSLLLPASAVKYIDVPDEEEEEDENEAKPKDVEVNLHELVSMFTQYMKIAEFKTLQYKA